MVRFILFLKQGHLREPKAQRFKVAPRAGRIAKSFSASVVIAASFVGLGAFFEQDATAVGDSRSLSLFYVHTKDTLNITYKRNGYYDRDALKQLNYFLRDWRRDEPTEMDPKLFDVLWEVYREAGYEGDTITVMSAYRAPETNEMLRRRSRAVAKHSQHTFGKAMDTSMPGVSMSKIREIGMRLQRGGVGYYPTAGTPFVHLDVGSVRSWPRMSTAQLVSLFPDQKTVHLPSDGPPLAGYQEALAEIQRNGGSVGGSGDEEEGSIPNFFAALFGGGSASKGRTQVASRGRSDAQQQLAYAPSGGDDTGVRAFLANDGIVARNEPPSTGRGRPARARAEAPIVVASNAPVAPTPAPAPPPAEQEPIALQPRPQPVVEIAQPRPPQDLIVPKDAVPMPPRRPTDLLIASLPVSNAPMPPSRPAELAAAPASGLQLASAEPRQSEAREPVPLPPIIDRQQVPVQALGYATTANVASFIPLPPLRGTSQPQAPAIKLVPVAQPAAPAPKPVQTAALSEPQTTGSANAGPSNARIAARRPAQFQVAALIKDGIVATRFETSGSEKLAVGKFTSGMTKPLGASFVKASAD
ncbi:MAG: DUF882 domain-containing protein [Beijerinckiaceae bacterium]|nr:DUF882 domain-containing protein [Beijerinckiaceae bacterium]